MWKFQILSKLNLICILITCYIVVGQNNTGNIDDNITNLNKKYDKYHIKKNTKETPAVSKMTSLTLKTQIEPKKTQAIPKKTPKAPRKTQKSKKQPIQIQSTPYQSPSNVAEGYKTIKYDINNGFVVISPKATSSWLCG